MTNEPQVQTRGPIERGVQTAMVVVGALSMSVVLFGVVGTLVASKVETPVPAALPIAIVAAATFALLGSVMYRRLSYQSIRLVRIYEAGGEAALASYMVRTTIVSAALAEAVGLFGLVMAIMTGDTYYLYVLCLIALGGVLSNFPRARRWRDMIDAVAMRDKAGATSGNSGFGLT